MKSPIRHHLIEMRFRLLYCFFSLVITFLTAYYFSDTICYFLARPLILLFKRDMSPLQFIYTDMSEAFTTYMKVSFFIGSYFCLPFFLFHLWAFFVPGLYHRESRMMVLLFLSSFAFYTFGFLVAYYLILPLAWKFFFSFQQNDSIHLFQIQLQPKMNEYFLFVIKIFFLLGMCFQFPLILVFLYEVGFLSASWLVKRRNYACVFSLILAAALSPPDVGSQILLFLPLFFLYESSIFIMKLLEEYSKIK